MDAAPHDSKPAPLSLQRLTAAFAQMLGGSSGGAAVAEDAPRRDGCEVGPRSIIEAVLFVGAKDGRARSVDELAGAMRDVTPDEVAHAVEELNDLYQRDAAPYQITLAPDGYRLVLRPSLERLRDRFYGRVKEARLSTAALEVLSVVAYRQPTTAETINRLRGAKSNALLSQLVRRGLVRRDGDGKSDASSSYYTTDRFLKYFRLDGLDQLPRAAELDD